jgi:hypothetical protein
MDKAGAYGIPGFGATIVDRVDGDYFAVMGLALGRMVACWRSVASTTDSAARRARRHRVASRPTAVQRRPSP